MVLPTYIPLVDAAEKYGYELDKLKKQFTPDVCNEPR